MSQEFKLEANILNTELQPASPTEQTSCDHELRDDKTQIFTFDPAVPVCENRSRLPDNHFFTFVLMIDGII